MFYSCLVHEGITVCDRYKILGLFILALLVFSSPTLLRWYYYDNPTYIGTPTYLHARVSQYIMDGTFEWRDPLSFGGRPYTYQPFFSFGLAAMGLLIGLELASVFYVSIFGAVGVVFFFLIARKYLPEKYALLSSVLLTFIPGMIFVNSHISTRAPAITLGIIALYVLMRDKKIIQKHVLLSSLLLGLSFLFHFEPGIIFLVLCGAYMVSRKEDYRKIATVAVISVAIFMLWLVPFVATYGFPEPNLLHEEYRDTRSSLESPTVANYFWEIENKGFLNFAIGAVALVGIFATKDKFLRFWLGFSFIMTLMFERLFVYFPLPVAIFAVLGLKYLGERVQKRHFLVLLIIIIAYTLFFGANRVLYFAQDYPVKEHYEAFTWIKENTAQDAVILSDWQWGHWINGLAERKNFVDGYAEYAPDVNKRILEMRQFFKDCSVPKGYGIQYVYMEDWFAERGGITCLSSFELVYDKYSLKVYKV